MLACLYRDAVQRRDLGVIRMSHKQANQSEPVSRRSRRAAQNGTSPEWSDDEVRILMGLWAKRMDTEAIAVVLGRSAGAVAVKASRLGLPDRYEGDRDASSGSTKQIRPCLRCRTPFVSSGRGHRICDSCKKTADWKSGGEYAVTFVGQWSAQAATPERTFALEARRFRDTGSKP